MTRVQGREVSTAELGDLLDAAPVDPAARTELRAVTSVDGRPVDLERVLDGADGAELRDRLDALRVELIDGSTDLDATGDARSIAEQVLDDAKFDEQRLPRPFKGALEWLADLVRPVGEALSPLWDLVRSVPGGAVVVAGLAGALLAGVVWWLVRRSGAAATATVDGERWRLVDPDDDPSALERRADEASAQGDHEVAVRLRYEAGLLRLAAQDRIVLRPQTTAASVAAEVDDPTMHDLTATFERVVYGGEPAGVTEADAARAGWLEVLGARSRR